jgi:hypothetical protein
MFRQWQYDLQGQKKKKIHVTWFGNFVYHMHSSSKMVACTFCRIEGFKHIN